MARSAAAQDEIRQPLLSNANHGPRTHAQQPLNQPRTELQPGTKDGSDNVHWLEKLVFKTRLRFVVSLCALMVFCTLITIIDRGQAPWSDLPWPWHHQSQHSYLRNNPEYRSATSRLSEQPFCLPPVSRYKPSDVNPSYAQSRATQRGGQTTFESVDSHRPAWGSDCPKRHVSQPMHCVIYNSATAHFDRLAGSNVREARQLQRDKVQVLISIAEGEPIYTRTTFAPSSVLPAHPSSSATESSVLRSSALWATLQSLSEAASRDFGKHVTVEQLLEGLGLDHSRVVTLAEHSIHLVNHGPSKVLETTLLDAQKLVQSLVAVYNGLLQTSATLPLNPSIIGHLFGPVMLSTDGSTSTTRTPFDLVKMRLAGHGGGAFRGVGRGNSAGLHLQHRSRSLDLLVLNEVNGRHELSITINLERGLVATALADLSMGTLYNASSSRSGPHAQAQANGTASLWDWMQSWFVNVVYDLDWNQESRMNKDVSGTYRYESHLKNSSHVPLAVQDLEWFEVDIRFVERALWITRIEYSLASNSSFPYAANADQRGSSISVLQKYNVGGTADFFGGWTCRSDRDDEDESLVECYRPFQGDDDSKCKCKDWLLRSYSSYRVGLWPTRSSAKDDNEVGVYQIPQGAIRSDGNSYMDQGLGGCPALWRPDRSQSVPELDRLGYHLSLTEPRLAAAAGLSNEARMEWLGTGLMMQRVQRV